MTNPLLDDLPSPPTPSELDIINLTPPLDLTALDIDKIIADHRQRRALKASGEYKRTKAKTELSMDLSGVLSRAGLGKPAAPIPPQITKPVAGGSLINRWKKP